MVELPLQKIRSRLKLIGSGPVFAAQCPAHDDKRASLSVSENAHGDALITCHAGCPVERIVDRIGLTMQDLFVPDDVDKDAPPTIYIYRDERGEPLIEVRKTWDKRFSQRKAGSEEWKLGDARRVPYRLPELLRAKPSEPVFIVEGEKDVENAMSKLGIVATCNLGGANKGQWREEWSEFFAERHIVIIPDNDEIGQQHAGRIFEMLEPVAASAVILQLPNLPPKGDLSDWIKKGGTRETLMHLVDAARRNQHPDVVTPDELRENVWKLYREGLKRGMSTGWATLDPYYTVRLGEWTLITGAPGAGKSTFADALCLNLAVNHSMKIGVFSAENIPIERHITSFSERFVGKPFEEPQTRFGRERMTEGELDRALDFMNDRFFFVKPREQGQTIDHVLDAMSWMVKHGCKILLIDPWTELDQDRPKGMTETEYIGESLWKIRRYARLNDVHPIMVAHPAKLQRGKDGKYPVPTLYDISGSAQWYNMSDNGIVIYRDRDSDDNLTELHVNKIRFREVGRTGMVRLGFDRPTGRFSDLETDNRLFSEMDDD